jgi:hypothetical protein
MGPIAVDIVLLPLAVFRRHFLFSVFFRQFTELTIKILRSSVFAANDLSHRLLGRPERILILTLRTLVCHP